MKKLLYILAIGVLFAGCSKDDTKINYLTSVERAKEGIIGTWENVTDSGQVFIFTKELLLLKWDDEYIELCPYSIKKNKDDEYELWIGSNNVNSLSIIIKLTCRQLKFLDGSEFIRVV
jgi:hypothetical protein